MIIRFDIYDMNMRERAAAALLSLGFVEDPRRGYTLQIEPQKRLHALFASDGLELHCDLVRANQTHRNVKHKQLRPTFEAIRTAIGRLSPAAPFTHEYNRPGGRPHGAA